MDMKPPSIKPPTYRWVLWLLSFCLAFVLWLIAYINITVRY